MPDVIADTGPIIHLDEIDALYLLDEFDELLVPQTVIDELEAESVPKSLHDLEYTVRAAENTANFGELDPGETAALQLCRKVNGTFLTDDLDARDAAKRIGVEVHGSIGVVLFAYSKGVLTVDETKTLIRGLKRDTSLYLSSSLVEHAITLIEDDLNQGNGE